MLTLNVIAVEAYCLLDTESQSGRQPRPDATADIDDRSGWDDAAKLRAPSPDYRLISGRRTHSGSLKKL